MFVRLQRGVALGSSFACAVGFFRACLVLSRCAVGFVVRVRLGAPCSSLGYFRFHRARSGCRWVLLVALRRSLRFVILLWVRPGCRWVRLEYALGVAGFVRVRSCTPWLSFGSFLFFFIILGAPWWSIGTFGFMWVRVRLGLVRPCTPCGSLRLLLSGAL